MTQADPTTSTSILNADTPSWSEIDGILSDKYKSESEPAPETNPRPTQSTQDTVVQQPLDSQPQASPLLAYYSQPQFRERSFEEGEQILSSLPARVGHAEMSTPPRLSSSSDASFGSSQRERIARLRRELLEEEERVMAKSEMLAQSMRDHAKSALVGKSDQLQPSSSTTVLQPTLGLDSSQQLTHSILDEQSRARLKIAKPPSVPSDPEAPANTVSVDITPLTEDLLMNSRVENGHSDSGQTISDGQFPNEEDEIIFTPLSDDDDFAKAFATPPRVQRRLDKKVHRPTPKRSKVQLQSHGKVIGITELGSFDETSSLSIIDKDQALSRYKDTVKPLRRHAWSDSETENSLSKSLTKRQMDELRSAQEQLPVHAEKVSPNFDIPLEEDRPRSAFAALSPHEGKSRPLTAPSSEKVLKFEVPKSTRFLPEPPVTEQKTSETSLDTNDYPNLHNSFVSLQNTIMSDIAALRQEIVEKQEGTEKLRAEFSDFKHAYYRSVLEAQAKTKQLQDAKIQTSQTAVENKENSVPPPRVSVEHKDTSYSECDSETDRQLATLKALQRSLREQSNQRYLRDLEQRLDAKAAKTTGPGPQSIMVDRMQQSSPAHLSNRSIQTAPPLTKATADANCNTSDIEATRPKSRAGDRLSKAATASSEHLRPKSSSGEDRRSKSLSQKTPLKIKTPVPVPRTPVEHDGSGNSSLDSTEQATRDLFMEILRKKAEMDEQEQKSKNNLTKENHTSVKNLPSSTPKPGCKAGKSSFTPASIVSEDSTLTDCTFVMEEDVVALNALWSEFMKFVVKSRALKQHKSKSASKREPCIQVDVKNLEKLHRTFDQDTYRKGAPGKDAKKKKSTKFPKENKTVQKKAPDVFEVSAGDLKMPRRKNETCSQRSVDSRQNRIDRLIKEVGL